MKKRLSLQTQKALAERNLAVGSLWQPPTLFRDNGRRLKQVAEPGDPWVAQIFYPAYDYEGRETVPWYATMVSWGQGDTADEAVAEAMRRTKGLSASFLVLGAALGQLTETINEHTASLIRAGA